MSNNRPTNWTVADIPPQTEKLAVVTGTGGLGYPKEGRFTHNASATPNRADRGSFTQFTSISQSIPSPTKNPRQSELRRGFEHLR
jgi:hypothetical protein